MNALTSNLRTHFAVLRDGRKIPITERQAEHLETDKKNLKHNEFIEICDPDTGKVLYKGEIGAIREFEPIRRIKPSGSRYYCDFWILHPLQETCYCKEKFRVYPGVFRSVLQELYGKGARPVYASEITPEIREDVILASPKF